MENNLPKIVIVGGGAGGLELATRLGNKLGKNKASVILIDRNTSHLWKPLLHEIAVGTMDEGVDAVSYRGHANAHNFKFRVGTLCDIDRENKEVVLEAIVDEDGTEVLPPTRISYDYLVMSIGSVSNDFNTEGVRDNCIYLDSPDQAYKFRRRLLNRCLRIERVEGAESRVKVAIVGGGATGVELSAELHQAVNEIHNYGFTSVRNDHLDITLLEAGERLLPVLPERISSKVQGELVKLGVDVKLNTMVTSASDKGLSTKDGTLIEADLMVWAAGIKVPEFMANIGGLETNRINQLAVNEFLQTKSDPSIFAIGDCAEFINEDGSRVPPRAQSAHQMASTCYQNILALVNGKEMKPYLYKDYGSLVSLARFSTVGTLMGNLHRGSLFIEGHLARMAYISLYRMHQLAIHGWIKTALVVMVGRINRWVRPRLKLH